MPEPVASPAYLVGHQLRLLRGLCRLVLAHVAWRISPMAAAFEAVTAAMADMRRLLDG